MADLAAQLELAKRIIDRLPLCPDHRDKVRGRCLECVNIALLEALEAATNDETSPVYHSRGCSQHLKGRLGAIRRPCDCGFAQWLDKARAVLALARRTE